MEIIEQRLVRFQKTAEHIEKSEQEGKEKMKNLTEQISRVKNSNEMNEDDKEVELSYLEEEIEKLEKIKQIEDETWRDYKPKVYAKIEELQRLKDQGFDSDTPKHQVQEQAENSKKTIDFPSEKEWIQFLEKSLNSIIQLCKDQKKEISGLKKIIQEQLDKLKAKDSQTKWFLIFFQIISLSLYFVYFFGNLNKKPGLRKSTKRRRGEKTAENIELIRNLWILYPFDQISFICGLNEFFRNEEPRTK